MTPEQIESLKELARSLGAKRLEIDGEIVVFDSEFNFIGSP